MLIAFLTASSQSSFGIHVKITYPTKVVSVRHTDLAPTLTFNVRLSREHRFFNLHYTLE